MEDARAAYSSLKRENRTDNKRNPDHASRIVSDREPKVETADAFWADLYNSIVL